MPISKEYAVEQLTAAHFLELVPLMRDAFGTSAQPDYFRWKYLDNPAGPAIGTITRHRPSGAIAAFYGMIPEWCRYDGERRLIHQSCDTMTHSAHRRQGLFQALALETYAAAKAVDPAFAAFGFGGPTSTPGFLKMGWRITAAVPYVFRPFPLTLLPQTQGHAEEVEILAAPDQRLLDRMASEEKGAHVERSAEFLRWRLANPLREYIILRDRDAYAVVTRAGDLLFVIDYRQEDGRAGRNVRAALRALSLRPRSKGLLSFCQPGSELHGQLRSAGFLRNPLPRGPASGSIPLITYADVPSRWAVGPLDHDSY